jgi:hypothetical protein
MECRNGRIGGVKRGLPVLLIFAVLAFAVLLVWPRENEPEYQGKKLSDWLGREIKANGDTVEAVHAMGTNVLPYLVEWLDYVRPTWQYKLMQTGRKCSPRLWDKYYGIGDLKVVRMNNAIWAFDTLGAEGTPAIAGLVRLMKAGSTNVAGTADAMRSTAEEALHEIAPDALTNEVNRH